jgi:hypothetical protein
MQRNAHDSVVPPDIARPDLINPYQAWTAITSGLVVLLAFLAGYGLYKGNNDYFDYHEIVGGLFFIAMAVQIGMTWILTKPGGIWRQHLLVQNGLIVIFAAIQAWLGYNANDSAISAASHFALGVFICAYAGGVFSHAWQFRPHHVY